MFMQPPGVLEQRRRIRARLAAFGLQGALLLVLLRGSSPLLLTPADIDQGIRGSSGSLSITYLAPVGPEATQSTPERPQPVLRAAPLKPLTPPKVARSHQPSEHTTSRSEERRVGKEC